MTEDEIKERLSQERQAACVAFLSSLPLAPQGTTGMWLPFQWDDGSIAHMELRPGPGLQYLRPELAAATPAPAPRPWWKHLQPWRKS